MLSFPLHMRILMVENERVIASQTAKLLLGWGHDIIYCGNDGRKLLEITSRHPPDLILTGFYLKGRMKGVELVERLWARWDVPVVVISGVAYADLPEAWNSRPRLFFLAKPFLPSQLHLIIEKALPQANPGSNSSG